MIAETKSQIKNYAIISQFGRGGENKTVTLIPIEYDEILRVVKLKQIDGVVRLNKDGSIYRIQDGEAVYRNPRDIDAMARILGLHNENRGNWSFSEKRFDFEREGFVG